MKGLSKIFIVGLASLVLVACNNDQPRNKDTPKTEETEKKPENKLEGNTFEAYKEGKKVLVLTFGKSGELNFESFDRDIGVGLANYEIINSNNKDYLYIDGISEDLNSPFITTTATVGDDSIRSGSVIYELNLKKMELLSFENNIDSLEEINKLAYVDNPSLNIKLKKIN